MHHDHADHSPSEDHSQDEPRPGCPVPGWVNVIFRGLFLFVERRPPQLGSVGYIEVVIPDLGSEHVYRAGNFLAEETLQRRGMPDPYFLSGVKDGNETFDDKANIVLDGFDYDPQAPGVYARLVVPKPSEIISLRPTGSFQTLFDGTSKIHGHTTNSVHVLRYAADDLCKVSLGGHPAPLTPFCYHGQHFANLHVISEPDHSLNAPHTVHGFHALIGLIPKLRTSVELVPGFQTTVKPCTEIYPDKGFAGIETSTLAELHHCLTETGKRWRWSQAGEHCNPISASPPFSCAPLIMDGS
ncbi:MAG TPA: hypothetical protein VKU19_24920 [Bryobacteraceae bacterium]|nr:hypothetical protein [Bryobacteraceae bacterium]